MKALKRILGDRRTLNVLLSILLFVSTSLAAEAPFTSAFQGTGRACYGGLYVRTKTISWLTSFSRCQKVPYEMLERQENGHDRRFTFRLKQHPKGCRFEVLYLYHRDIPNPDIDWHVIGYASLTDYRADKQDGFKANSPNAQACSLVAR